jgi:hypothetical protein
MFVLFILRPIITVAEVSRLLLYNSGKFSSLVNSSVKTQTNGNIFKRMIWRFLYVKC